MVAELTRYPGIQAQPMQSIIASLHEASQCLPSDRWTAVCLDTMVHLAGAAGGMLFDSCGVVCASLGLCDEDIAELATVSLTHLMPDGVLVQVHLPSGTLNVIRMPLRAHGQTTGMIVLTSRCEDPFGPDIVSLMPMLSSIAHDMLGSRKVAAG